MQKTFLMALCTLLFSCADPLKGKNPYWYNGYVYGTQAYGLYAQGKLQSAIASYKKAMAEAQRLDIPQQVALYKFNSGRCYYELDSLDSALECFSSCYREFLLLTDTVAACRSAGFAALCFCSRGNADSAMTWYKLGTALETGSSERALWLLIHGRLIWLRDHRKEALNYFEEAFSRYKKQQAYNAMARTCLYRAGIYYYFGDFPEAKKLIDEALALGDRSTERFDRWRVLLASSAISSCLGDRNGATWFYGRALKCAPQGFSLPVLEKITECGKYLF